NIEHNQEVKRRKSISFMMSYNYSLDRLSISVHTTAHTHNDTRPAMKRRFAKTLALSLLLAGAALFTCPARAEMNAEAARASVAPFYKALNAEFATHSAD